MLLTAYRRERGLTQAAFVQLMADAGYPITQALVSQWESGATRITPERAMQIDEVTNGEVSRDALIWGPLEAAKSGEAA